MKDELMDKVVETITKIAHTGNHGDGLHCAIVIWYHKDSLHR